MSTKVGCFFYRLHIFYGLQFLISFIRFGLSSEHQLTLLSSYYAEIFKVLAPETTVLVEDS